MTHTPPLGVRWTIGDVSDRGFEALRLSIAGAFSLYGPEASYAVCANTVPPDETRDRTGDVPADVSWIAVNRRDIPPSIRRCFSGDMAEGVAWKLAPVRLWPDRHELSLDNDCILWSAPATLRGWLSGDPVYAALMAEDVRAAFGRFAPLCPPEPRNAGIRAISPGFDYEAALREAIARISIETSGPIRLDSELDEQGLQTAALSLDRPVPAVPLTDVTICSPFHPHRPDPGRCGVHLVGLNARHIPWSYYARPADEWMTEHWTKILPVLRDKVGLTPADAPALPT